MKHFNLIIIFMFAHGLCSRTLSQNVHHFDDFELRTQSYLGDGSFVFIGTKDSINLITKVSSINVFEWALNPGNLEFINGINTIGNSIYVSGFKQAGNDYENYLIKLDRNGNILWSRMQLTADYFFPKINNQNENNILNYLVMIGKESPDLGIHVFDTNGTEIWNKTVPLPDPNLLPSFTSAFDNAGNLFLNFCNAGDFNLVKFSNTGNLIFHHKYVFNSPDIFSIASSSIIITNSNRIFIVGTEYFAVHPYIVEFNTSGTFIRGKYFQSYEFSFRDVISIDNFEYINATVFCGDCVNGCCFTHSGILKLDDSLNLTDKLFFPNSLWEGGLSNGNTEILMNSGTEYVRLDTSAFVYCDSVDIPIVSYDISTPTMSSVSQSGIGVNFVPTTITNFYLTGGVSPSCVNSTEELEDLSSFYIYPNPNNGKFSVNYNLGEKTSGSFRIYDAIGKLIYDEDLIQNNGSLNLNLQLSDGFYLWEVKDSDGILLRGDKIVVVN